MSFEISFQNKFLEVTLWVKRYARFQDLSHLYLFLHYDFSFFLRSQNWRVNRIIPAWLYFNWSVIALHCCASVYSTTAWISYTCTSFPSFLSPPPLSPVPSLEVATETQPSPLWYTAASTSRLSCTWWRVSDGAAVSICPILCFPHCSHKSILYVCVSIAALQIGSSIPFF